MNPSNDRTRGRGRGQRPNNENNGASPWQNGRPKPQPAPQQQDVAPAPAPVGGAARGAEGGDAVRGAVRGRRILHEIVRSKPAHVQTKKGTTGRPVALQANYHKIIAAKDWTLFQYRVDFAPDIEVTLIRRALLNEHKKQLGGFLFDGTVLFMPKKLKEDVTELIGKRRDDSVVRITIKKVGVVESTDSHSLQVLNLILRRAMEGLHLQLVGRNLFDAAATIGIPAYKLELWPGYVTSIRQHENDILVCSEITSKVMRKQTLLDILSDCIRNSRDYKTVFEQQVVGMTVLTDYNNKTYRIDEVDWDQKPSDTFEMRDGLKSFISYYKTKYNITIRDGRQPLLISKSKDRQRRGGQAELLALIPELCRATGLTDEMRSNFQLMKAVAEHTRIGPGERINRLQRFNQRLQNTPDSVQVLKDWGMQLDRTLVTFNGRELPQEAILYKGSEAPAGPNADWTRDLVQKQMYISINLINWAIISPARCINETNEFAKLLSQAVSKMGMLIKTPNIIQMPDDRTDTYLKSVDTALNQDPQLIMAVFTTQRQDRYQAIKKKCCIDRAVPTQVICHKTITPRGGNPRGLLSVATKVAIQMNCKLGGAPWMIKLPLTGLMTVGFDVTHDTKDKSKSYGALVATMDHRGASIKFFSAVSAHKNGEELSNELCLNMQKALREYQKEHGALPAKIIFYRDGVGEGQLHYVFEHEIKSLNVALKDTYEQLSSAKPRLSVVVVSKRINTRLFKGTANPQPGTVADDVITNPERYDFFLVSQHVTQGTVSPTHYNILQDESGLPADKMQILTYKFCHVYYNWSGTVRVPAVCQYAHKLAFLVGQHLHQPPSNLLDKRLYYL